MKKLLGTITFLLICISVVLNPTPAEALDITLRWDANTEPDLAGYKLYYKTGTSGSPYGGTGATQGDSPIVLQILNPGGPNYIDPANPNPEFMVNGLNDVDRYFFVLTAYDDEGPPYNESGYSNEVSNKYKLTINITGSGTVTCNPELPVDGLYGLHQPVELTAEPSVDYEFGIWGGSISDTTNPVTIAMDEDKTITATFTEVQYTYYNLIVDVTDGGTVDPAGGSYLEGTTATILAIPASGWQFLEWTGDHVGTANPAEILMDGHKNVQAVFIYPDLAPPQGLGIISIVE